jgi:hypothetical protein
MKMIIGGIMMAAAALGSLVSFSPSAIEALALILGIPGAIIFWIGLKEEDVEARRKGWKS